MKKSAVLLILAAFMFAGPVHTFAQFKSEAGKPNISRVLNNNATSYLFGLIDPAKMQMHHSFSLSYGAFGGGAGMALSTYINTIDYRISRKLFLQTNLGIMNSPYNTFNKNFILNKPQFFGSAQLQYNVTDNMHLMLRVEKSPFMYYQPGMTNRFYNDPFK